MSHCRVCGRKLKHSLGIGPICKIKESKADTKQKNLEDWEV
jgi:hypothetical protein